MKMFWTFLSWFLGELFFLLFLLSVISGHLLPSLLILFLVILVIPPTREKIYHIIGFPLPFWLRSIIVPVILMVFIFVIFNKMSNRHSIYKSPAIKHNLMTIYENKMQHWPSPYENRFINTQFGKVHIIISGPEGATPVMLLHASSVASWSWLYNIKDLNTYYRTYAIDTIGDAGKSSLMDINRYPKNGKELAELYAEIMDSLQIPKAVFIGASQGGFITTNMAFYKPERMEKVILSGPMGFTDTNKSVLRIMLTTMFPIYPIQRNTIHWAFGNDSDVNNAFDDWFRLILEGVIPRQTRPKPFTSRQLQSIQKPVLLILGKRDGLVGNPEKAKNLAENIPDVQVKILDTGHLISAERPDEFNRLAIDFIGKSPGLHQTLRNH